MWERSCYPFVLSHILGDEVEEGQRGTVICQRICLALPADLPCRALFLFCKKGEVQEWCFDKMGPSIVEEHCKCREGREVKIYSRISRAV